MKQEEKSRRSYDKIRKAAIAEFGTKSYENASLNNICNHNDISKGLLYHNFKNKDELYLCCVKVCFHEITVYLRGAEYDSDDFRENMKKLLDLRYRFFHENLYYSNIFFNTILQPPSHLMKEIKEIRKEFDQFHSDCYREIINCLVLRDGITTDMATEYFFVFQEMFNGYFQSKAHENADFQALIKDHEIKLSNILDIMLYGIAKEDTIL